MWNLVLTHCLKQVILKLQAQPGYEENALARNPVRLLEILCDVAHNFNAAKNRTMAIVKSDMKIMIGFQGKTASIDHFATLFRSRVDTIKAHGGRPGHHPAQAKSIFHRKKEEEGWIDAAYNAFLPDVKKAFHNNVMNLARQAYLACLFVRQADAGRYG